MYEHMDTQTLSSFLDAGLSLREIAKQTGLGYSTVRYYTKKAGLASLHLSPILRKTHGEEVTCKKCSKVYVFDRKKGHSGTHCNTCYTAKRKAVVKARALTLLGGACVVCGYDKCPNALHFHHKDPTTKEFNIGKAYNRAWEKIKIELGKCEILCANHHAEKHFCLNDR